MYFWKFAHFEIIVHYYISNLVRLQNVDILTLILKYIWIKMLNTIWPDGKYQHTFWQNVDHTIHTHFLHLSFTDLHFLFLTFLFLIKNKQFKNKKCISDLHFSESKKYICVGCLYNFVKRWYQFCWNTNLVLVFSNLELTSQKNLDTKTQNHFLFLQNFTHCYCYCLVQLTRTKWMCCTTHALDLDGFNCP